MERSRDSSGLSTDFREVMTTIVVSILFLLLYLLAIILLLNICYLRGDDLCCDDTSRHAPVSVAMSPLQGLT